MKNNEDHNLQDHLLKDLFRKSEIIPTAELKEQIMLNIVQQKSSELEYEPVISRKTWWIIGTGFISLLVYLLIGFKGSSGKSYFDFDWSALDFSESVNWFTKLNIAFDEVHLQLPELHFTTLASLSAIMVMGISFIITYRMKAFQS